MKISFLALQILSEISTSARRNFNFSESPLIVSSESTHPQKKAKTTKILCRVFIKINLKQFYSSKKSSDFIRSYEYFEPPIQCQVKWCFSEALESSFKTKSSVRKLC